MKTLAATLLISLSGKKITEDAIEKIFNSVGITKKDDEIKSIVKALQDKKLEDIMSEGLNKCSYLKSPIVKKKTSSELLEIEIEEMEMKEKKMSKLKLRLK